MTARSGLISTSMGMCSRLKNSNFASSPLGPVMYSLERMRAILRGVLNSE